MANLPLTKMARYFDRVLKLAGILFFILISSNFCWAASDSPRWQLVTFLNQNRIYTLRDYAGWLQKNVHYQSDASKDQWADPLETISKHAGDCEDFAFLSAAIVEVFGYQPHVIAVGSGKNAHAICVFKYQNVYYAFDNNQFNNTRQITLEKLVFALAKSQKAEFVLELSRKPKNIQPLYVLNKSGESVMMGGMDH